MRRPFMLVVFVSTAITSSCGEKNDEPSKNRAIAEKTIRCPEGTALTGGDGALRSSYSCARPGDPPGKFHGPYGQWYADGTPALLGEVEDGAQTGTWTVWHANGSLQAKGEFRKGVKHGRWIRQSPDGAVIGHDEYENGTLIRTTEKQPDPPESIPAPADVSCAAVARRVVELAQRDMGGGKAVEDPAARRRLDELQAGLPEMCEGRWSELQRTCFMLMPSLAAMRWCGGEGPAWCEGAAAHMLKILAESGDSAGVAPDDLAKASGEEIRACLVTASMTREQYECILRSRAMDEVEKCFL